MTEPTKEAVECALALVDELSATTYNFGARVIARNNMLALADPGEESDTAAARILAAEVRRLREDADIYCGWKRWRAGIWRVSHTESGPSAEWLCEEMPPTKVRIGRALES